MVYNRIAIIHLLLSQNIEEGDTEEFNFQYNIFNSLDYERFDELVSKSFNNVITNVGKGYYAL